VRGEGISVIFLNRKSRTRGRAYLFLIFNHNNSWNSKKYSIDNDYLRKTACYIKSVYILGQEPIIIEICKTKA